MINEYDELKTLLKRTRMLTEQAGINNMAKSMLESWTVETYEKPNKEFFNPALPNMNQFNNVAYRNQPSLKEYKEYLWLFGAGKR